VQLLRRAAVPTDSDFRANHINVRFDMSHVIQLVIFRYLDTVALTALYIIDIQHTYTALRRLVELLKDAR